MSAPGDFTAWMASVQAGVETALDQHLPPASTPPTRLHEAMRYAVLGGGKRVRPLLVHAAGALFDAPAAALARAAAAIEMLHAYSLVHDDLPCMDDDALRRGKATVHVQYDEATALLVGDALQAQAFLVLAGADGSRAQADGRADGDGKLDGTGNASEHAHTDAHADAGANAGLAPARLLDMLRLLAQAAGSQGMCGGQAIDLGSVGVALDLAQLEQMHRMKTGALLQAAVLLGACCGKALDDAERAALTAYADAIGLAFQVVDDVLDATADSQTLGKTAGKDAAANKPTYVSILGLQPSRALAEQLRNDAYSAIAPFGVAADRLRHLADLIVQRKA